MKTELDTLKGHLFFAKGHLTSASQGESGGEVVFVFFVENMMNRSKTCFWQTRPI